jgi:hypothetical protein
MNDTRLARMARARLAVLGLLGALSTVAAGCGGGKSTVETGQTTGGTAGITLRGSKLNLGPWSPSLSLRLVLNGTPTTFYACAVWKQAFPEHSCEAAAGTKLPAGATMRLEQRPVGPALERADSPGWGLVATSEGAALEAVLSNNVSGNRLGTVTYRVTLRNASGRVLARSNELTVDWHK